MPASPPRAPEVGGAGADWSLLTLLLSAKRCAPILALGAALEGLAQALAGAGGRVIALRQGRAGMEPARLRGPRGAPALPSAVQADSHDGLPFRGGSVGVTILNEIGEGQEGQGHGDRVAMRERLLLEARRVLRPEGILCLVISRPPSRLGPLEVRALLKRCGFSDPALYMPYPRSHRFAGLLPIASGRDMQACIDLCIEGDALRERRKRIWLKLLARLGLLQRWAAEYVAIAKKEA